MTRYWIGVASKDHINLGVAGGFCQLCHGKKAPLARMKKDDKIIYYAPKTSLKTKEPYQKIIAVGTLIDEEVYPFEMFPGFVPYRRNVQFETITKELPLAILRVLPEWEDYHSKLRFGHFEINEEFYQKIYDYLMTE